MSEVVTFFCPGVAASQGSKRGFVVGKRAVLVETDKGLKSWRGVVATSARQAGAVLIEEGAVGIHLTFLCARPRGHYRTGKRAAELREDAPPYPDTKGSKDVDKMARAVFDALTGVCFGDDSQVAHAVLRKRWFDSSRGQAVGCVVTVERLSPIVAMQERILDHNARAST